MSTAGSKQWRLKKADPRSGNPGKVLPLWFKHSKLLKTCYHKVSSSGKSKALRHLSKCLQAVRLATYIALLKSYGHKEVVYDSPFRWILHCPPAGGEWVTSGSPMPCRNLFCPWCWIRRHDLLYRSVTAEAGAWVSYKGRTIRGLGIGKKLHCLSFRALGQGFFSSVAHLNEFKRQTDLEVRPFRDRPMLRVVYPMPGLLGATIAFMSDRPFENMTTGTVPFPSLSDGRMGVHVTTKPRLFSRLMATRSIWIPELLTDPVSAVQVAELFRGKHLFNTSRGKGA